MFIWHVQTCVFNLTDNFLFNIVLKIKNRWTWIHLIQCSSTSPPSHISACLNHLTSINKTSFMTSGTHSLYLTLKFPRLNWINMWCLLQEQQRLTPSAYIGFNFGTKMIGSKDFLIKFTEISLFVIIIVHPLILILTHIYLTSNRDFASTNAFAYTLII